jgi:hypothetical protein
MSRLPSKAKPARPQGSAVPGREAAGPPPTYAAVRVSVSLRSAGASGGATQGWTASASASLGGKPAETNCRKRVAIQALHEARPEQEPLPSRVACRSRMSSSGATATRLLSGLGAARGRDFRAGWFAQAVRCRLGECSRMSLER